MRSFLKRFKIVSAFGFKVFIGVFGSLGAVFLFVLITTPQAQLYNKADKVVIADLRSSASLLSGTELAKFIKQLKPLQKTFEISAPASYKIVPKATYLVSEVALGKWNLGYLLVHANPVFEIAKPQGLRGSRATLVPVGLGQSVEAQAVFVGQVSPSNLSSDDFNGTRAEIMLVDISGMSVSSGINWKEVSN